MRVVHVCKTDGSGLRAARTSANLTLKQLAEMIPYSYSMLSHFESGRRVPGAEVFDWYARAVGVRFEPLSAADVLGKEDTMDRRSFLNVAKVSTALTLSWLDDVDVDPIASPRASSAAGSAHVRAYQDLVDALRSADETSGGKTGRNVCAAVLSDMTRACQGSFANEAARRKMLSTTAQAAYLCGWKWYDSGNDGAAQRYFDVAASLSREASDPAQQAFCMRMIALLNGGRHRHSDRLAARAMEMARGRCDGDTFNLLRIASARTAAEHGDHRTAQDLMGHAESCFDTRPSQERPRWADGWAPGNATTVNQMAQAFQALGETDEARTWNDMACQAWPRTTHSRAWALAHGHGGLADWRVGDFSAAEDKWDLCVPELRQLASSRCGDLLSKIESARG